MSGMLNSLRHPFQKYGTGTIITLCLVYFAQGFKSFSGVARTLYFKNTIGLSASASTILSALIVFSWYLKPLYGLMSDSFPLFGYHRKSYLFATGVLGILSYSCFLFSTWYSVSIVALVLTELSQAIADVICDGLMIQKARIDPENGANDLQRYSWGSLMIGAILGATLGGNAAEYVEPKYIIASLAICPLLVMISSISIDEERVVSSKTWRERFIELWNHLKTLWFAVKNENTARVVAFVVLWGSSMLSFGAIFVYYLYDARNMSPAILSYLMLVGYASVLLATALGSNSLINIGIVQKLLIGRIIISLFNICDIIVWKGYDKSIGVHYYYFLFGGVIMSDFLDMIFCRMPILIIFAKMTPKHIEATYFALLCSSFNIGNFFSSALVSFIMETTGITNQLDSNAWILSLISIVVGFLSLFLLFLIPKDIIKSNKVVDELAINDNNTNSIIEPLVIQSKKD